MAAIVDSIETDRPPADVFARSFAFRGIDGPVRNQAALKQNLESGAA